MVILWSFPECVLVMWLTKALYFSAVKWSPGKKLRTTSISIIGYFGEGSTSLKKKLSGLYLSREHIYFREMWKFHCLLAHNKCSTASATAFPLIVRKMAAIRSTIWAKSRIPVVQKMDFFIVFIILLAFDETIILNIKKGTIWLDALQFIKKENLALPFIKLLKQKLHG